MSAAEVITFDQIELVHPDIEREIGLICPDIKDRFIVELDCIDGFTKVAEGFDELSEEAVTGYVIYASRKLRISNVIENGNRIRSICVPTGKCKNGRIVETAVSIIETPDGKIYGEKHHDQLDLINETVREPSVGHTDITPLDQWDIHLFEKVSAQARPVRFRSGLPLLRN